MAGKLTLARKIKLSYHEKIIHFNDCITSYTGIVRK
jgi:hypothetical protein